MEYSPMLHSLCRLSAETGGRSKWSLVATDLPASIRAGDQSAIFFPTLSVVCSPTVPVLFLRHRQNFG